MTDIANTPPATPAADPWAAASAPAAPATDPWGSVGPGSAGGTDWLQAAPASAPTGDDSGLAGLWHHVSSGGLPVQDWINTGLNWVVENFRPFFQSVRTPIDATLAVNPDGFQALLAHIEQGKLDYGSDDFNRLRNEGAKKTSTGAIAVVHKKIRPCIFCDYPQIHFVSPVRACITIADVKLFSFEVADHLDV